MKNSSNSTSLVAELGASYDASQNASKKQQEYFLNEQLKSIKEELGQDVLDSKQKPIQKLHKENVNIPE
jgi:ATP-dependent Lon protease